MKDPLQSEEMPWEILGVDPDAEKAAIDRAFMETLRRAPGHRVAAARAAMLSPIAKARHRLLCYDDAILATLAPNPLADPAALDVSRRMSTAVQWENQLKRKFPDPGVSRLLAVLWYWWALHEEERYVALLRRAIKDGLEVAGRPSRRELLRRIRRAEAANCQPGDFQCREADCPWRVDCLSSAPVLEEMWRKVIAYWGMLAATAGFWDGTLGISPADGARLQKDLMDGLHNRLLALRQHYAGVLEGDDSPSGRGDVEQLPGMGRERAAALATIGVTGLRDVVRVGARGIATGAGISRESAEAVVQAAEDALRDRSALSRMYQDLEVELSCEIKTAKAMATFGARTAAGTVCCGVLMLRYLGLMETMRGQLKAVAQHGSATADELGRLIVPGYMRAKILLDENKPGDALVLIDALPTDEQNAGEIRQLRGAALFAFGKQHESLGRIEDALEDWGRAIRERSTPKGESEMKEHVVARCLAAAQVMKGGQIDRAIDMLERGLAIVSDQKLTVLLADLLTDRGVAGFKRAIEDAQRRRRALRATTPGVERPMADLRRGVALGSARAAQNLEAAESNLAQGDDEIFDLPDDAGDLLEQAAAASRREDWGAAVACLRQVVEMAGGTAPKTVRKSLSVALANEAMAKRNRAVDMRNADVRKHEHACEEAVGALKMGASGPMSGLMPVCAKCHRTPDEGDPWFSFQIPGGPLAGLCQQCADALRSLFTPPPPNSRAVSLLREAEQGFLDATGLDPESGHPADSLEDVRRLLQGLGPAAPATRTVEKAAPARKAKPAAPKSPTAPKKPAAPQQATKPAPARAPESAQRAKKLLQVPAARAASLRGRTLSLVVLALWTVAVVAAVDHVPGIGRPAYMRVQDVGGEALARASTVLATAIAVATLVAAAVTRSPRWLWDRICVRRWRDKSAFDRLVEVALYASAALTAASCIR